MDNVERLQAKNKTNAACHTLGIEFPYTCAMSAKKPRRRCESGCGRYVNQVPAHFCSLRCFQIVRQQKILERFKRGRICTPYQLPRAVREYLIEKAGERCCRCGWAERNPVTNRVPLEIEHLDGDWRNSTESNLSVLCPSCHALTPSFRGLNRGRGRPGRLGLVRTKRDEASGQRSKADGGTRTHDSPITGRRLYPAELRRPDDILRGEKGGAPGWVQGLLPFAEATVLKSSLRS